MPNFQPTGAFKVRNALSALTALAPDARRGGVVAGGAAIRILDGLAQLAGAATLPDHRRRGVQSALLHVRLIDAANAGCDLAVVTTQPGSKSQENVQKAVSPARLGAMGWTLSGIFNFAFRVRSPKLRDWTG